MPYLYGFKAIQISLLNCELRSRRARPQKLRFVVFADCCMELMRQRESNKSAAAALFRFSKSPKALLCIKLVPLVAAQFLDSYNRNGEAIFIIEARLLKS